MMNKKIPAFTLIELLVAMALSGIVIGIIYSAFMIIEKQYLLSKSREQQIHQLKKLDFVLENDFNEAESITKNQNEINLRKENNLNYIVYTLEEKYILRTKMNMIDTFWLQINVLETKFLNQEIITNDFIDELNMEARVFNERLFFTYRKKYASQAYVNKQLIE